MGGSGLEAGVIDEGTHESDVDEECIVIVKNVQCR